jgi:hypothetical protein
MARLQKSKQAAVTTGSAKSSGIPCAMVLTLIARSPWETGFLAPITRERRKLARLASASGGQDHTPSRPHRRRSSARMIARAAKASTASRAPRVVTIGRNAPLQARQDGSDNLLIWGIRQALFLKI